MRAIKNFQAWRAERKNTRKRKVRLEYLQSLRRGCGAVLAVKNTGRKRQLLKDFLEVIGGYRRISVSGGGWSNYHGRIELRNGYEIDSYDGFFEDEMWNELARKVYKYALGQS